MKIKVLEYAFSICKVADYSGIDPNRKFTFIAKTDEENSLICPSTLVPANTVSREDGWSAFRIEGVLDFSLVGILARISAILAENGIGIFAVSTFNTDYIFIKSENLERAADALTNEGYELI